MENYYSAACVQIVLDLLGCLLLADFVRRIAPAGLGRGAALATLWLAALCPFTASYTAEPLTETPTLFVLALAMWAMVRFRDEPSWAHALWFTLAVSCAALLRPDGALAGVVFAIFLFWGRNLEDRWETIPGPHRRGTGGTLKRRNQTSDLGKTGVSAAQLGAHGGGLRFAGTRAICHLDGAQLAGLSCF